MPTPVPPQNPSLADLFTNIGYTPRVLSVSASIPPADQVNVPAAGISVPFAMTDIPDLISTSKPEQPSIEDITAEDPPYTYPTVQSPVITEPDIPAFPDIDMDNDLFTVPDFRGVAPESFAWAYEAYTDILMNLAQIKVTGLDTAAQAAKARALGRLSGTWTESFNLLTSMGLDDDLAAYREKELMHHEGLFVKGVDAIEFEIVATGRKLKGGFNLEIEKQKNDRINSRNEIELTYANEFATNAVRNHNNILLLFAIEVEKYKAGERLLRTTLTKNALQLKRLDAYIEGNKTKASYNQTIGDLYRAGTPW